VDDVEAIEFEAMLLGRHVTPASGQHRAALALDRSVYVLLTRLELDGPMSIPQLKQAFGLDSSTLNRQTASMLRAQLVDRIADPEGGIARKFSVSANGGALLRADRQRKIEALTDILEGWSDEDRGTFVDLLRRFNRDIEQREGRPWPRPTGAGATDRP
jgi:DNA-binding MarR family transcriptional regulator